MYSLLKEEEVKVDRNKCTFSYGAAGQCKFSYGDHVPGMSHSFQSDGRYEEASEEETVPSVPYSLSSTSKVHIYMEIDKEHLVSMAGLTMDGRKFIETIFSQASVAFKEAALKAIKEESWK